MFTVVEDALAADPHATHVQLLSGVDYPARPEVELEEHLVPGRSYVNFYPMLPGSQFDTIPHTWCFHDQYALLPGGLGKRAYCLVDRLNRRLPARTPPVTLYRGSIWMCLARPAAEYVAAAARDRDHRRVMRYLHTINVPDEIAVQTLLGNSPLAPTLEGWEDGAFRPEEKRVYHHYIDWDPDRENPAVLEPRRPARHPRVWAVLRPEGLPGPLHTAHGRPRLCCRLTIDPAPPGAKVAVPRPINATGGTMTGRVVHFEIPFDDGDRARSFYSEAFGWQLMEMPEMGYTIVMTGPTDQESGPTEPGFINGGMFERSETFPGKAPNLVIDVASVDDALAKVKDAGGTVVNDRMPVGEMGFTGYFTDTEGNLIGLGRPPRPYEPLTSSAGIGPRRAHVRALAAAAPATRTGPPWPPPRSRTRRARLPVRHVELQRHPGGALRNVHQESAGITGSRPHVLARSGVRAGLTRPAPVVRLVEHGRHRLPCHHLVLEPSVRVVGDRREPQSLALAVVEALPSHVRRATVTGGRRHGSRGHEERQELPGRVVDERLGLVAQRGVARHVGVAADGQGAVERPGQP